MPYNKKTLILFGLPLISGLLTGVALLYLLHWLAWFMVVPLFYSIIKVPERAFLKGFLYGFAEGIILLVWMFTAAGNYTGEQTNIGFPLWLFSSVSYGIFSGFIAQIFCFVVRKIIHQKTGLYILALFTGALWILFEWGRFKISQGIPWLNYQVLCTQSSWDIPIQILAFTGNYGLSFIIITVNVLLAGYFISGEYKRMLLPLVIYSFLVCFGIIRIQMQKLKKLSSPVSLLCENISARERWSTENGDSLANIYFRLNFEATKSQPKIIIWSETAVPWSLSLDDDFLTQCLNITWPVKAGHIIGVFTPSEKESDKQYNSAYYIEPDGAITGRYDKMKLLTFLEKPFAGAKLPVFQKSMHTNLLNGKNARPLKTPIGKAGILICNESLYAESYHVLLTRGADYFVVMSNDAWFEGSELIRHHFYFNRFYAVAFGQDIIINSNRGISGIIDRNGKIRLSKSGMNPFVLNGSISSGNPKTFYAKHGDWFVLFSGIILFIIFVYLMIIKKGNLGKFS